MIQEKIRNKLTDWKLKSFPRQVKWCSSNRTWQVFLNAMHDVEIPNNIS